MNNNVEIYKVAAHIIQEGFKSAGIEDGDEFKGLAKLLNAKKMTVDKFGEEHWEEDYTAVSRGVELTLRLKRLLDNKVDEVKDVSITHRISTEDIGRLEAIAAELKGLEERLKVDIGQKGKVIEVIDAVVR